MNLDRSPMAGIINGLLSANKATFWAENNST
jgi:hypothetical protein